MNEINLKQRMMERQLGGVLIQFSDSPAVLYAAKQAGLDFMLYDCEHGIIPYEKLHDLMLCGNALDLPSIVRVPELSRAWVSRILDFGAAGVMVPMMETREQAQKLAEWAKYPPLGRRSYSGGAHTGYAASGGHSFHMEQDNSHTVTIAQIETARGLENAEEILSAEGIDAVMIGPADLAISLGHPDTVLAEDEIAGIRKVSELSEKYGKGFGIIGGNALLREFAGSLNLMVSAIEIHLWHESLESYARSYEEIRRKP